MPRELFGTDGIRGVAGSYPLDHKTANAVGAALGQWVTGRREEHQAAERQVVIGMDTRESGPWLAAEVAGGLAAQGVASDFAGHHHHARSGFSRQERTIRRRRDDFGLAQSVSG